VGVNVIVDGAEHVRLTLLPSLTVNDVAPPEPVTDGVCTLTEKKR
jgi:hypothetical protein